MTVVTLEIKSYRSQVSHSEVSENMASVPVKNIFGALLLSALLGFVATEAEEIRCRNPDGKPVEWFILYKLPKTAGSDPRTQRPDDLEGSEYGYADSETVKNSQAFVGGTDSIFNETNNPLAKSLARLYENQKAQADRELMYMVYNDQPPPDVKNSTSNGHTKGIVLFGAHSGLWIVHSVPEFPENLFSGKYSFPSNARENGQSLLCITMDYDQLETVVEHVRFQKPNLYAVNFPHRNANYQLDLLLNKKYPVRSAYVIKDRINAINGTVFTAFTTGYPVNKDVYSDVIAPALKTDLYVKSWRNGNSGRLPPDCFDRYKVTDIEKIALKVGKNTMQWSSTEDNSKWAVGDEGNWACFGSINRMLSQLKRSGEDTICLQNAGLRQVFSSAIAEFTPCPVGGAKTRERSVVMNKIA